jgi:hypothetical protein
MKLSWIKLFGALLMALMGTSAAQAGPVYRAVNVGSDTVGITGLADNGNVLLGGFGDSACERGEAGKSALRRYDSVTGTFGKSAFFVGLPIALGTAECGVRVDHFNSADDAVGASRRQGVYIPTFWRNGVAIDLRDPANSGLVFTPDPFVVPAFEIDLDSLDIINRPFDLESRYARARWTNALGMYTAKSQLFSQNEYVLIPIAAAVPEPGSVLLVVGALAALVASRRSARARG